MNYFKCLTTLRNYIFIIVVVRKGRLVKLTFDVSLSIILLVTIGNDTSRDRDVSLIRTKQKR